MPSSSHPRWLLLSDIHFRQRHLDRIQQTARWILSLPRQYPTINRVVICGDLLTTRTMQPTDVLSATYRFLSELSDAVPHVNILLGNHDLAYRRDYASTALDALGMRRLSPYVSLHADMAKYDWDGRRVLVLPFREEQGVLTEAVASLEPGEASETVAFGHLAINRAVTQRHIVRSESGATDYSARYRGLTGPDHFSTLARTFTGHFHSHQTMVQPANAALPNDHLDRLQGSITYIGSPLQLSWSDLYDKKRGVVLLDPATLEHELVPNPHAVSYITVQASQILNDEIEAETVADKNVMVLGDLTRFRYLAMRDKLLSLGARDVREWRSMASVISPPERSSYLTHSFGAYVPVSDREVTFKNPDVPEQASKSSEGGPGESRDRPEPPLVMQPTGVDPLQYVRTYVQALGLDSSLDKQREALIQLGQRLILAPQSNTGPGDLDVDYKTFLDQNASAEEQGDSTTSARRVFVAQPRSLTITNFLGVQEQMIVDFHGDFGRGLTFVVGSNGSGKSTLIEAMVWCQFGRCVRSGLAVGDVVNDVVGKDCMVTMSFANGYTITRYRKHNVRGNRVIVSLNGEEQPQFEQPDARSTQAVINELLGIDYETFIRTVVLGHESAASFLSSTPAQRYELIESTLGLSTLDKCANLSRQILRGIDGDASDLRGKLDGVLQTMDHVKGQIASKREALRRLHIEQQEVSEKRQMDADLLRRYTGDNERPQQTKDLSLDLQKVDQEIKDAQRAMTKAKLRFNILERESVANETIRAAEARCQLLQGASLKLASRVERDSEAYHHFEAIQVAIKTLGYIRQWFESHVLDAVKQLGRHRLESRIMDHGARICLIALDYLAHQLESVSNHLSLKTESRSPDESQRREEMEKLQQEKAEAEKHLQERIYAKKDIFRDAARDMGFDDQYAREFASEISGQDTEFARNRLTDSIGRLQSLMTRYSELQNQQAEQQRRRALELRHIEEATATEDSLKTDIINVQQKVATYQDLVQGEQAALVRMRADHVDLEVQLTNLMSSRDLFAFWETALSKRRVKAATASTFRAYILDKSLTELNALAADLLATLYEGTRHVREMTTGMLRAVLSSEDGNEDSNDDGDRPRSVSAAVLDQTLGVTTALSYAKRSGGERKRIDLAVFFALVQVAQAHSPHRARYMLVDEAFDSLDAAGQSIVVRWCAQDIAMARTDFRVIVTHSEHLAATSSSGSDDDELRCAVMEAVMTEKGTRFRSPSM